MRAVRKVSDLGTMLHQFCLGKNPSATRKILKSRVDQHKVFAGVVGAPTLDDLASLTAPNSISLQESFPMYQILRIRLCVVLEKILRRDHPNTHSLFMLGQALMEWEMDLEE